MAPSRSATAGFEEASDDSSLPRAPSAAQSRRDRTFRLLSHAFALLSGGLVVFIVLEIVFQASPAMRERGLSFLSGRIWDPNLGQYGILPEIWGTLYTSALALALGAALGLGAAIFLSEGFLAQAVFRTLKLFRLEYHRFWRSLPDQVENALRYLIELLAAIPSVVYGLWGIYVVIPALRPIAEWLHAHFAWLPVFSTPFSGPGIAPAVLVLAIMVLPTVTALCRDALVSVPTKLRMAAYGMGATRWETIVAVIIPTAVRGIFGAVVLAFGRALGETMALAMLVGNANQISVSLFSPANTLAALLANSFPEAGPREVPMLMYAAMVLLALTLLVNVAGAYLMQRTSRATEGVQ